MGFFSSIGDFVSGAWDGVKDAVGGVVDWVGDNAGDALGVVGDVAGGILGSKATSSTNASNQAFAREQLQFQKNYIQNRLQWQVEDAKKAGLHPMVAAGISPTSFSPVSLNNSPIDSDWVGQAGQSLAYAAAKAKDRKQQQEAWNFTKEMNEAQIDGVRLDNELKVMQIMSQLALLNQTGPSAPSLTGLVPGGIDGQPDSLVNPEPMRTTPHTEPGKEPGSNPSVGWLQNDDGSIFTVMSDEAKQRLEEDFVGTTLWNIRHRLAPHVKTMFGRSVQEHTPPKSLLPKRAVRWEYAGYGVFVPLDSKGNRVRPSR